MTASDIGGGNLEFSTGLFQRVILTILSFDICNFYIIYFYLQITQIYNDRAVYKHVSEETYIYTRDAADRDWNIGNRIGESDDMPRFRYGLKSKCPYKGQKMNSKRFNYLLLILKTGIFKILAMIAIVAIILAITP